MRRSVPSSKPAALKRVGAEGGCFGVRRPAARATLTAASFIWEHGAAGLASRPMSRQTAAIAYHDAARPFSLPDPGSPDPEASTWRMLGDVHDVLGIDRRAARRSGPRPRAFTVGSSPWHTPTGGVVGIHCGGAGWAVVEALSLAPNGLIVHAVPTPALRASVERRALLSALAGRCTSALAWVGTCVLSRSLVASLADAANPDHGGWPRRTPVTLLAISRTRGNPVVEIHGHVTPLTDPNPETLAIALTDLERQRWVQHVHPTVGTQVGRGRVRAVPPASWIVASATAPELERSE